VLITVVALLDYRMIARLHQVWYWMSEFNFPTPSDSRVCVLCVLVVLVIAMLIVLLTIRTVGLSSS